MKIIKDEYSYIIENVFHESECKKIYNCCRLIEKSPDLRVENRKNRPNRNFFINDENLVSFHQLILPTIENLYQEKLKPSYNFYSSYYPKSSLPAHRDRPICYITASYCVTQTAIWPFYIGNSQYHLKSNDMIIFKGHELKHHRNENIGDHTCSMILFHIVKANYQGSLIPDASNVVYED